tara:strand:+ start:85 stop:528 length:444 start_codon:yes stop_codon:yes gene_type:complete
VTAKLKVAILAIFSLSLSIHTNVYSADHEAKEISETEKVLKHHLEAFGAGDVEEILKDYTEDSVVITQDGAIRGIEELRELFTGLTTSLPPGSRFVMLKQVVEGEYAYIVWSAGSAKMTIPFGTDTFRIVDGKIVAQTFAAQIMNRM